jgi:hypothetical protein
VPPVPPLPWLGGVCGVGAGVGVGAGAGVGVGVPPVGDGVGADPVPVDPEPSEPESFFFLRGVVSVPVGTDGVVVGWNVVGVSSVEESPPLDATATTTIRRKSPTHARATSLRRR